MNHQDSCCLREKQMICVVERGKWKTRQFGVEQLSSESPKVRKSSQVQRKSQKEPRTWTLLTVLSSPPPYNLMHPPYNLMHHPTLNFHNTSRGPTPKCYTFLETSHDPQLGSKLRCKNFAHFFATLS